MYALDGGDQIVLVQGALHGLDGIAGLLQPLDGDGVDVLQQQHLHPAARKGPAARQALGVQHLIQRSSFGVGDLDHRRTARDLGEGVEGVGRSGQLDLGVVPAVADHDHATRQIQGVDHGRLAVGVGQGIGVVDARDPPVRAIDQVVAQHPVGRNAQQFGHRRDHLAEAAGQNDHPALVLLEEVQIAPHRGGQPVGRALRQGLHMVAGQGQQGQTPTQRLPKGQVARHGLIGQGGDLGPRRLSLGRVRQGEVGQGFQCLEIDQGRIKVEDQGGARSHGARLSRLRACGKAEAC